MRNRKGVVVGRKRLVLGVVAILSATLSGLPEEAPKDPIDSAKELIERKKFNAALQLLDLIKQRDPKNPRPYLYSGIALVQADRKQDAEIELNSAFQLGVEQLDDALALAHTLEQLDRKRLAFETLNPLEDRLSVGGIWFLADLHYQQHRHAEALRLLQRYQRSNPSDPRLPGRLGELYLMAKDYPKALSSFEAAIQTRPGDARAQFGLAQALWLHYRSEPAREAFIRAAELDPGNPRILHLLGIVCNEMKEPEEAVRYLKKAARLPDTFSRILFDLGNSYRQVGQAEEAKATLQQYQELYAREEADRNRQQKIVQLNNQAAQQLEKGQVASARDSFLRVLQEDKQNWSANLNLAKIYLSSGVPYSALSHLERLLGQQPESSEANYLMAVYWSSRQDTTRALTAAEKARLLRPGHPDLRNLLGNLYHSLGREKEALQEYRAAVNLAPDRPGFRINLDSLTRRLRQD
ncbi:MAG: tetratricopeptide repeat protein [Acidobacteriota bacterium]